MALAFHAIISNSMRGSGWSFSIALSSILEPVLSVWAQ
jgi:hypothetical protein